MHPIFTLPQEGANNLKAIPFRHSRLTQCGQPFLSPNRLDVVIWIYFESFHHHSFKTCLFSICYTIEAEKANKTWCLSHKKEKTNSGLVVNENLLKKRERERERSWFWLLPSNSNLSLPQVILFIFLSIIPKYSRIKYRK